MENLKLGDVYKKANQLKEQEYQRLRHSYKTQSTKFEDWEFPPGKDALGNVDIVASYPDREIVWKRPHELVHEWDPNAKPVFIGPKGVCRFDINQGGLGDCWYLAALAKLATEKDLFRVVVPDDNKIGFDEGEYSGAFHFRYWRAGVWTEVVIDDRLPCYKDEEGVHRLLFTRVDENYAFWTPLAEKAFAKLYGSYELIEGGLSNEALEDFTGGISIMKGYWSTEDPDEEEEVNKEYEELLRKAHKRKALIGVGSKSVRDYDDKSDGPRRGEGIAGDHAYSITGLEELVDNEGNAHFLLRLRNPWGHFEWTGKWNDNDDESWATVPKDLRGPAGDGKGCDDGEFWISLKDVLKRSDQIYICYWSPLAYEGHLDKISHPSWDMRMLRGEFCCDETANPFMNNADLVKCQSVTVNLSRSEDPTDPLFEDTGSSICTLIVALIYELYGRAAQDTALPIFGFRIFRVPDNHGNKPYDVEFFETAVEITEDIPRSGYAREVNKIYKLEEGTYCIVPFLVFTPPKQSEEILGTCPPVKLPYLLRIFSEKKITTD